MLQWLFLLASLPLRYSLHPFHPQQQAIQADSEPWNNSLLDLDMDMELIPERLGSISSAEGAQWIDSCGGVVGKIPGRKTGMVRYTCTLAQGTILYHTDIWGKKAWAAKDLPLFLSPDILASAMMEPGGIDWNEEREGDPILHVFQVQTDIPDLIYWYKKYYPVWFAAKEGGQGGQWTLGGKKDFQGCTTAEHDPLIQAVCKGQLSQTTKNGWRAPYDQDEVMLCSNKWIKEIAKFDLGKFNTEFKKVFSFVNFVGQPPCKEPCMYAYNAMSLDKKVDRRKEAIALLEKILSQDAAGEFAKVAEVLPVKSLDTPGNCKNAVTAGAMVSDRTYKEIQPPVCKDNKCC